MGRVVYSHGPIIRRLTITSAITSFIGCVALILAVIALTDRIDAIQLSRQRAAVDSCAIIRTLVLTAAPPNKQRAAIRYLDENGLHSCAAYGRHVVRTK